MDNFVIVHYTTLAALPDNWQNPRSWPKTGAYRIMDGVCDQDLYFVAPHFVSVSFDVLSVIDALCDVPDEQIDPMAKVMAEAAIQRASKSSLKGLH